MLSTVRPWLSSVIFSAAVACRGAQNSATFPEAGDAPQPGSHGPATFVSKTCGETSRGTLPAASPALVATEAPIYEFSRPDREERLRGTFGELDRELADLVKRSEVPGLAYGLVIDGELAHTYLSGFADLESQRRVTRETMFRVGSITKTITALAIRRLADDALLSLDDPVERFVPGARGAVAATSDGGPVRLRHLLAHTSGWPLNGAYDFSATAPAPPTESDVVAALRGLRAELPPGAELYSNLGYSILGIVVARASGHPYRDYLAKALFGPLHMSAVDWEMGSVPEERRSKSYRRRDHRWQPVPPEQLGASEADGGLITSLTDLARWATFHLEAFPPRNDPDPGPLRRATVRDALSPHGPLAVLPVWGQRSAPLEPRSVRALSKAHGWSLSNTCASEMSIWKDGGIDGYVALVQLLPEHGIAQVSLANGWISLRGLHTKALDVLRRSGGLVPRRLQPGTAVTAAALAWLELRKDWSEVAFGALHNDYFRASVDPAAQRLWSREHHQELGDCALGEAEEVLSPRYATFRVDCARGDGRMTVRLDGYTDRIAMLATSWRHAPEPERAAQASSVARRLLSRAPLSGPPLNPGALASPAEVRRELAAAEACAPGAPLPSDSRDRVVLPFRCRSVELQLALSFDERGVDALHLTRRPPQDESCAAFE